MNRQRVRWHYGDGDGGAGPGAGQGGVEHALAGMTEEMYAAPAKAPVNNAMEPTIKTFRFVGTWSSGSVLPSIPYITIAS